MWNQANSRKIIILFLAVVAVSGCKSRSASQLGSSGGGVACPSLNTDNCNRELEGTQIWQVAATMQPAMPHAQYYVFKNEGGKYSWEHYLVQTQDAKSLVEKKSGRLIINTDTTLVLKPGSTSCGEHLPKQQELRLYFHRVQRPEFAGDYSSLLLLPTEIEDEYLHVQYEDHDPAIEKYEQEIFLATHSYRKAEDFSKRLDGAARGCFILENFVETLR